MLGARLVAVDGVIGEQLQVDMSRSHPHLGIMPGGLTGLAYGGEESDPCAEVGDNESSVQSLSELAPIRKCRRGDLLAAKHVHNVNRPVSGHGLRALPPHAARGAWGRPQRIEGSRN